MITFNEIFIVIKKYWYFLVATITLTILAFSLYAAFALPIKYESSTRLYCFAVNDLPEDIQDNHGYTDKFAASHAIAMLSSDGLYYELYDVLSEEEKSQLSAIELKESISYKLYSNELNIVDISCLNSNNEIAQGVLIKLNTLIETKLKKLPFENTSFKVLVDEYPSLNRIPITESKNKYYVYGILIGLIACVIELAVFSYVLIKKGLIKRAEPKTIDENESKKAIVN